MYVSSDAEIMRAIQYFTINHSYDVTSIFPLVKFAWLVALKEDNLNILFSYRMRIMRVKI